VLNWGLKDRPPSVLEKEQGGGNSKPLAARIEDPNAVLEVVDGLCVRQRRKEETTPFWYRYDKAFGVNFQNCLPIRAVEQVGAV
jgi:hypothetical protein